MQHCHHQIPEMTEKRIGKCFTNLVKQVALAGDSSAGPDYIIYPSIFLDVFSSSDLHLTVLKICGY
jgi:hypothetical protein